jgi:hypothetical protein
LRNDSNRLALVETEGVACGVAEELGEEVETRENQCDEESNHTFDLPLGKARRSSIGEASKAIMIR